MVLSVMAMPSAAYAQTPAAMSLGWEAPAGCPQLASVRERIRAIAGPPTERESRLQAQGTVTKEEGKLRLRLVIRDGEVSGERVIVSGSCEDLAGAAAVVLGLLLRSGTPLTQRDLEGEGVGTEPHSAQGQEVGAADEARSEKSPAPSERPESEPGGEREVTDGAPRSWKVLLRAPHLVADWGPLPQPSFGLALGLGAKWGHFRALLVGKNWLHQTLVSDELPGYSASLGRQSLEVLLCHGMRRGRFELGPCLVASVEQASARGAGDGVTPRDSTITWGALGLQAFGSARVFGALALVAELGLRVETSRPVVKIGGLGELGRLGPLAATSAVSAEWSF